MAGRLTQASSLRTGDAGGLAGLVTLLALIAVLAFDLYPGRSRSRQTIELQETAREYAATLTLAATTFDPDRFTLTTTLTGKAYRPWRAEGAGGEVWVSIDPDLRALTCDVASGEEDLPAGKHDLITFTCAAVTIPAQILGDEVFYPFDHYRVHLRPRICVNYDTARGCRAEVKNVAVKSVELNVSDRTLQIVPALEQGGPDRFSLSVRRKFFLRLVTGTFALLASLFLLVLTRLGKPEELVKGALGYFGTLWGLRSMVVPSTVRVFPTIVDYTIFGLFTVLFVVLLVRWWGSLQEVKHG